MIFEWESHWSIIHMAFTFRLRWNLNNTWPRFFHFFPVQKNLVKRGFHIAPFEFVPFKENFKTESIMPGGAVWKIASVLQSWPNIVTALANGRLLRVDGYVRFRGLQQKPGKEKAHNSAPRRARADLTADLERQSLKTRNSAPWRARADLTADLESL